MPLVFDKNQRNLLAFVLGLGGFWLLLCLQLSFEWSHNPQYQYGLSIPFIGAYLVYLRYRDRPRPQPPQSLKYLLPVSLLLGLCCLYPLVIIFETNADWRLLIWSQALLIFGLTLLALWSAGAWPWVKHFSWAFVFFLCGVPWPSAVESILIQHLLHAVSAIAVEGLHLVGIPALQSGNIIQMAKGLVSMENACSGIRSFQSSLMLAYFLGELFRLRLFHRWVLFSLGPLSAVGFNVFRTFFVAVLVNAKGSAYANQWHGLASQLVFIACLGHLGLWALYFRRFTKGPTPKKLSPGPAFPLTLALPYAMGVFCASLFSLVFARLWYDAFPPALPYQGLAWHMQWDRLSPHPQLEAVPPSVKEALFYDQGAIVRGNTSGIDWLACYFNWKSLKAAQLAGFHGPELCLPALGWGQALEGPPLQWEQSGIQLVFRTFKFQTASKAIYVFFVQWDQSAYPYHQKSGRFRKDRLLEAWQRHRSPRKTSLELVLAGPKSFAEAQKAVEKLLQEALVVTED